MEQIMSGQAFGNRQGKKATKILEVNFRHPIIKGMRETVDGLEEDEEDKELEDYANMLYDVALVNSGFKMDAEDIEAMTKRLQKLVRIGMKIPLDAEIEPMPEFATDEDVDEDDDDEEDDDDDEAEDDEEEVEENDEEGQQDRDEL